MGQKHIMRFPIRRYSSIFVPVATPSKFVENVSEALHPLQRPRHLWTNNWRIRIKTTSGSLVFAKKTPLVTSAKKCLGLKFFLIQVTEWRLDGCMRLARLSTCNLRASCSIIRVNSRAQELPQMMGSGKRYSSAPKISPIALNPSQPYLFFSFLRGASFLVFPSNNCWWWATSVDFSLIKLDFRGSENRSSPVMKNLITQLGAASSRIQLFRQEVLISLASSDKDI